MIRLISPLLFRKHEIMGYQHAVESMGEFSLSIKELAVWLNSILSTVWCMRSGGLEPRISISVGAT